MNPNAKRTLIRFRSLFPVIAVFLTILLMFIPCYRYTTVDTGLQEAISLVELSGNAWDQVCGYLFETVTQTDHAQTQFSWSVIALLSVFFVLFLLAVVSSVYVTIQAFHYFKYPENKSNGRVLFITLIPNRIVAFFLTALVLPWFFFSHWIISLYDKMLHYYVTLTLTFPDPLILAFALWLISVILAMMCRSSESALSMNPFTPLAAGQSLDADEEPKE